MTVERGVDDSLSVPFSPEELVARILVIMRRAYRSTVVFIRVLRLGDLEIGILNRRVRAGESRLHLTPLEQDLLYLLAANAGRLLTRNEILDHPRGVDVVSVSDVVDRHVRDRRATLQDDWQRPRYITTGPGTGYRFVPTVTGDWPGSGVTDAQHLGLFADGLLASGRSKSAVPNPYTHQPGARSSSRYPYARRVLSHAEDRVLSHVWEPWQSSRCCRYEEMS